MDGQYVPRLGMYPEQVKFIRDEFPNVNIDVHCMLTTPNEYIKKFIKAGADTIMVHVENQVNIYGSIGVIKSMGARAGVALNIATDVDFIEPLLDDIDIVMLMGFNPGILNQDLWPGLYTKIAKLKAMIGERDIDIMIDGGVKFHTIEKLVAAGSTYLVGGSSTIYNAEKTVEENVKQINGLINNA
jgi:ribulose-phosphate 3-epimerase